MRRPTGCPLAYLAHIADRLAYHLGADPGYQGLITRNPINPGPECYTHWGRMFPYTLRELDKRLPKWKAAEAPVDGHRAQQRPIRNHGVRSVPAKVGGHPGRSGMV